MPNDHRGNPIAPNHRPTPRLNSVLNKMWGVSGSAMVDAHRAGSATIFDPESTREAYNTAGQAHAFHDVKSGFDSPRGEYHAGQAEHYENVADMYRDRMDVNDAAAAAGGTAPLIAVAIKNRKRLKKDIEL